MKIETIYRYPIKGLSAQALERVEVAPQEGLPLDRIYAVALGDSDFDPAAPKHVPKTNFLMLMRHQKLARLQTHFDGRTGAFKILREGGEQLSADLTNKNGRAALERFLTGFMAGEIPGQFPLRLVRASGHMFSDVPIKCLSLINLNSIRDLEQRLEVTLDPLRFRANIYFSGAPAWAEMDWVGRYLAIGDVRLRGLKTIVRCAATNVNPATGERDQNIPKSLMRAYGHADMGLYAEVTSGGDLTTGSSITVL